MDARVDAAIRAAAASKKARSSDVQRRPWIDLRTRLARHDQPLIIRYILPPLGGDSVRRFDQKWSNPFTPFLIAAACRLEPLERAWRRRGPLPRMGRRGYPPFAELKVTF